MGVDLGTTNTFLGIMAVVSILEALLLIGMGVGGFLMFRRVLQLIHDLDARHAPLREKVDGILGDVRTVTASISQQTARVNHAITGTMDRVDDTAHRVSGTVSDSINQVVGVARGVLAVVSSLFSTHSKHEPPASVGSRL